MCVLSGGHARQRAGGVSAGVTLPVRSGAVGALQRLHPAGPGGGAGLPLPLLLAQVSRTAAASFIGAA